KKTRADEKTGGEACCHFCNGSGDGQVYSFWGGFHVTTKEIGSSLSNVTFIKSKYRNIRKCGVYVCEKCAGRIRRVGNLPWTIAWGLAVASFGGLAIAFRTGPEVL